MPSAFDAIISTLRDLQADIHEHNRRIAGAEVKGKVKEVDVKKHMARIIIGQDADGNEVLSPWLPYRQTAGALKIKSDPSVGQVMAIRSEGGDLEQGTLDAFWFNEDNAAPSDTEGEHVLTLGDVRVTLTDSGISVKVGGTTVTISGDGLDVDGGHVRNDGTHIDATHVHLEVQPGPGVSGVPQ